MAEQLDLFADTVPPEARPDTLGPANISYSDAKTLLTPASGFMSHYKFTLNPYSGCGFGCEYCYARFFASTEALRDSWGDWVKVKENAVEAIRKAQRTRGKNRLEPGDAIYMSSVTDPYQPVEKQLLLTRRILEALVELQPRLTIQTRSPMVTRDIDVLKRFTALRVNVTVTTDSEEIRLRYEPHCPSIDVRLRAAEELVKNGVQIGISISPMLPIWDAANFGSRIAALDAAEYVTQPLKQSGGRYSAGSSIEAVAKAAEDHWGASECAEAARAIRTALGPARPLLEGAAGYAPASPNPGRLGIIRP